MHVAGRSADCPNCGGPIEIKLGSSGALVCPYCRFSVERRQDELVARGKVADLVPTAPILRPGDIARVDGRALYVGGRVQLDHGAGPWDEFYVEVQGEGRWGYLAKAQGFYHLTFPTQATGLPSYDAMAPGITGELPGAPGVRFTVAERGVSTLVSAEGELPFSIVSGERSRYVDLSGTDGQFATLDYGDGHEPPVLYLGHVIDPRRVELSTAQPAVEKVKADKLSCPSCGGPTPIHAPETCEQAICAHCGASLELEGGELVADGVVVQRLSPLLPLGAQGKLFGDHYTIIGYMERSVTDSSGFYRWSEYLLYGEPGYRWMTEDGGHFVFFEPVHASNVTVGGAIARYDGRTYRAFQSSRGVVEGAVGEFYFRVRVGTQAQLTDYIAPPHVLSVEETDTERLFSHGTYIKGPDVYAALGLEGRPPPPVGVAPSQPNPHGILRISVQALVAVLLLCLVSGIAGASQSHGVLVEGPVPLPLSPGEPVDPTSAALRTPPFTLTGSATPVRFDLSTNAVNQWVGASCALIEQGTGEVRTFFLDAGYYEGSSGGERWTEGDQSTSAYLSAVQPGTYLLEIVPQWQSFPQIGGRSPMGAPTATLRVTSGERSPLLISLALLALVLPVLITVFRRVGFEARRKEGANL